jgi:NodT family efflux transporter outer membrane factor (OMF) lipoprotein
LGIDIRLRLAAGIIASGRHAVRNRAGGRGGGRTGGAVMTGPGRGIRRPAARLLWLPFAAVLPCGCNFAPHYELPKTAVAGSFKEAVPGSAADEGWKLAEPRDAAIAANWWEVFNDPDLNALEARVAISNQTVVAAEANYRAAQALVREAQASLFPTFSIDPSVTRSRSSAAVAKLSGGAGATTTTGTASTTSGAGTHNLFTLPVEASYQVDLWGSIRNNVAENRYSAEASAAQLAMALLSTQTTLAQDYFQLRVADEQRRILDTTVADYEASLKIVQTLFYNGLDSDADIASAESQLESTRAQATDVGVARAQYEHAIAVLIGVPPSQLSIPYKRLAQTLPTIPVGVPADLLERRADIAASERSVAETNAAIGVARAAYFPTLTLGAEAGYESTAIGQLLNCPNRFWSVGPSLAQTLFDGGARRAATQQARALNDQAVANYRQTVLGAVQSVEDNLASLRILSQELIEQHRATEAARRSVRLTLVLFKSGVDSYVNVITAQNAFLTSREAELQVQLKQLAASVSLIDNLGGGWAESDLSKTAAFAEHSPARGGAAVSPAPDAGPAVANPPSLPAGETEPDDFMLPDAQSPDPPPQ